MSKTQIGTASGSSFAEKLIYGIGDAGGAMLLSFPGAYLTLYCTDSLGLSTAFLGTMMLICRLFDGVSDIIMGIIVDRTHTKLGKARPWFIVSILPLAIAFIALFNVPAGWPEKKQIVYIYIAYFLMTVVFYTVNNIAYHAMLQRFSLTAVDRGSVSTVRSFLCVLFSAVMNIVTPLVIPIMGGERQQHTWTVLSIVIGGVSLIFLLLTAVGIKEKLACNGKEITEEQKVKKSDDNKVALKFLLRSKYFYLLILLSLVWFASFNMIGIGYYYARDVLGNGSLTGPLTMAGMVPCLLFMPFLSWFFKKYGKRRVIQVGLIVGAIASLCIWINPASVALNIVCLAIKCIAGAPLMAGVATLAGDVTDVCEQKIGVRVEGMTTSAYSVGVKIGTGLGGAFVAWGLAIGGYNYMLPVQSETTINTIIVTFCVAPAVLYALGAVFSSFWDVDKIINRKKEEYAIETD